MSQKKRKNATTPAPSLPSPDPDVLPPWLPVGDRWNELPEAVRQAVPRILVPAYRQFVLDAPDELQRSVGLTLVHLLWLEVCDQMHPVEVVADPTSLAATLSNPEEMIDRHLNLVAAKSQTAELLVKLRLVHEALARSAVPPLPRPGKAFGHDLLNRPEPSSPHGDCRNFRVNENGTVPLPAAPLRQAMPVGELEKQPLVDQQADCHFARLADADFLPAPLFPLPEDHIHV
jgi:hypothetical protein